MKKLMLLSAGIVMAGTWAVQASAETTLRFNVWVPPKHFVVVKGYKPWAASVEKATGGKVKIQFTTKSLGAPPRQFDLAKTGVADVVWAVQGYTAGRFVSAEIGELPFNGDFAESLSVAYWRTHNKYFAVANEYKGVKILGLHTHSPGQIMINSRKVTALEDLKGVKIRVVNPATSQILKLYGGVPYRGPAPKTYELFSKGIIDGSFMTADGILAFKLTKFAKYYIHAPGGIYNTSFLVGMNQAKWDALSAADRKAIESVSGEAISKRFGAAWDVSEAMGQKLLSGATNVTSLKGPALTALKTKLAFLKNNWFKKVKAKGIDGEAALKFLRAETAAYKK
ncbi:MAG: ABC transporter substrate-binding protein [Rhodospirillaceae bacterium]|nr:ABC transporter substrate-binding protein [Rhodospirillaceae bacterium]